MSNKIDGTVSMLVINFDDTFPLLEVASDLSYAHFSSADVKRNEVLLKVEILPLGDPLLPDVYNLAFGPPDKTGEINDKAIIHHANRGKVFSTILLFALTFLQANPKFTIGLDGSNNVRAYLYHRMFLSNRNYLSEFFVAIGVDWYVRLLRSGDVEVDENNLPFFKPKPELFNYQRPASDLYRYYMFYLR